MVVSEPMDIADLDAIDEQPVKAREVVRPFFERRGVCLLKVTRQRPWEVDGVLLVGPRPWRLELQAALRLCAGHEAPLAFT